MAVSATEISREPRQPRRLEKKKNTGCGYPGPGSTMRAERTDMKEAGLILRATKSSPTGTVPATGGPYSDIPAEEL